MHSTTIIPPYLEPGDTIALVAPARSVTPAQMLPAVEYLEEKGFKVLQDPDVYREKNQFGGTEPERSEFFNRMLADPKVKALWSVRGGYGSLRMIDGIDFSLLDKNPKWIAGFSDLSVILSHAYRYCGMATLHSTMPIYMDKREGVDLEKVKTSIDSFIDAFTGNFRSFDLRENETYNRADFSGEILGGNLSVLCSIQGSVSESNWDGKILFLEDLDEYVYHIDRMILMLKRAGKLENIKALLVGDFLQMKDHAVPFGYNYREIILQHCAGYGFPVIFDIHTGHDLLNLTIPMGVHAEYKNGLLTFATP